VFRRVPAVSRVRGSGFHRSTIDALHARATARAAEFGLRKVFSATHQHGSYAFYLQDPTPAGGSSSSGTTRSAPSTAAGRGRGQRSDGLHSSPMLRCRVLLAAIAAIAHIILESPPWFVAERSRW
jgi:hypothetical protein